MLRFCPFMGSMDCSPSEIFPAPPGRYNDIERCARQIPSGSFSCGSWAAAHFFVRTELGWDLAADVTKGHSVFFGIVQR